VNHRTASYQEVAPYFQGQFPRDFPFATATIEDLEPYLRGRISYIRALETGAVAVEKGTDQEEQYQVDGVRYQSQLRLYTSGMSEFQSKAFLRARGQGKGNGEAYNDVYAAQRQASNFIFPDKYWGSGISEEERANRKSSKTASGGGVRLEVVRSEPEGPHGFRRYVHMAGDQFSATEEFKPFISNIEHIRRLSCKYAEIARIVRDKPGNAFIYDEYVKGSGVVVLGLCLEALGFQRYDESTSMFTGTGTDTLKPFCSGGSSDTSTRRVRSNIQPALRYAILTDKTSDPKFQSMMEAMNSYENRHGDYIKALLSSRVGRDGINVSNVLQVHLVGSGWNKSAMYQAISRGLRATSHEDVLQEERDRLEAAGLDPSTARIKVNIYQHAAVAQDGSSIDVEMYRMSEYKDRRIKRVLRIMKQCAIGAQVQYNRNVRPTDTDYSAECDYDVCRYPTANPAPTGRDYSTYDVLYAEEVVREVVKEIISIYRQRYALTLEQLQQLLPQYRRKYLVMALEQIIVRKRPLTDRFGYTAYLQEDKQSFYLDRTYPGAYPSSYAMSYYSQGVIGVQEESLPHVVLQLESSEFQEEVGELEDMNPDGAEFNTRLDQMPIEGQVVVLEEAVMQHRRSGASPFTEAVEKKYHQFLFSFPEPIRELAKRREEAGRPSRKAITKSKVKPVKEGTVPLLQEENSETVYLHSLYSLAVNQTGYATTARYNKAEGLIRLYKVSEGLGWRDVNQLEYPVYNTMIQMEIAQRKVPFEDKGVYGFILPDGVFRIRDRETESPKAATDDRHRNRGRNCINWSTPELIDLMWRLKMPAANGMFPEFTEGNRSWLVDHLITVREMKKSSAEMTGWPLERLVFYYKWFQIKKSPICNAIRDWLDQNGALQR
jgi:hypothetical protein